MDKKSTADLSIFSFFAFLGIILIFLNTPSSKLPIVVYSLIMIIASISIITFIITNNVDKNWRLIPRKFIKEPSCFEGSFLLSLFFSILHFKRYCMIWAMLFYIVIKNEKQTGWLLVIVLLIFFMAVCFVRIVTMFDNLESYLALGLWDCGVIISFIMSLYTVKKKR